MGFIVIAVDNRGTPERGKAFHDWSVGMKRRQKMADIVTSLNQLGATRPFMDLKRVGIFGASHGGYFSIRALLLEPNVYHVAVSQAGATNRRDNAHNERVMGMVDDDPETYDDTESLRLASRLRGKLLLIHGTHDRNVDFSQTMKMVDALTAARKQYDLAILPNATHFVRGDLRRYVGDIRAQYFIEHLKPTPTIDLAVTSSGAVIEPGKQVEITASVTASGNAAVKEVAFQVNGKPVGVDDDYPFRLTWTAPLAGRHVLTASVRDSNGQATASTPLVVFVGKRALERTIRASTDDAEERENGSVVLDSFDLELVRDFGLRGSDDQTVGLRFERISVSKESRVTEARLIFNSWFPTQGDAEFRIHAELAPDAGAISSSPRNISSRRRTKASVLWSPSQWSVGETSACRTPDLSSLINEIVSLPEWESGNSVLFIITGAGRRVAKSFELEPAASPRLFVEYIPADSP
jgi:pimeloyl-ACP methyl ester carboxylesterase